MKVSLCFFVALFRNVLCFRLLNTHVSLHKNGVSLKINEMNSFAKGPKNGVIWSPHKTNILSFGAKTSMLSFPPTKTELTAWKLLTLPVMLPFRILFKLVDFLRSVWRGSTKPRYPTVLKTPAFEPSMPALQAWDNKTVMSAISAMDRLQSVVREAESRRTAPKHEPLPKAYKLALKMPTTASFEVKKPEMTTLAGDLYDLDGAESDATTHLSSEEVTVDTAVERRRGTADTPERFALFLSALETYKTINGDVNVKPKFEVPEESSFPEETWGFGLGHAVRKVRRGTLFADHKEQLEALGLDFPEKMADRKERARLDFALKVEALGAYGDAHGDFDVPPAFVVPEHDDSYPEHTWGVKLGSFVRSVSRRKLSKSQRDALAAVGCEPTERESGESVEEDTIVDVSL